MTLQKKHLLAIGILYGVMLHIAVIALLVRPDLVIANHWRFNFLPNPEPTPYVRELEKYFAAVDQNTRGAPVMLIGDSHFQRMDTSAIKTRALNFGAGTDTVRNMVRRIANYQGTTQASTIVIWGGANDLFRGRSPSAVSNDMSDLLSNVPETTRVVVLSVPPSTHNGVAQKVVELNESLAALCVRRCRYLDIYSPLAAPGGGLDASVDAGDGIHLNQSGYRMVGDLLNAELTKEPK